MKFGKSLSNQIEKTLPQWRDKFLSYKELKKKLKLVEAAPKSSEERPVKRARVDADMSVEEIDFRNSLEQELHKFNTFFEEKEEECIIKLKVGLVYSSFIRVFIFFFFSLLKYPFTQLFSDCLLCDLFFVKYFELY